MLSADSDRATSPMVEAGPRAAKSAVDKGDEFIHLLMGSPTHFTYCGGLPEHVNVASPMAVVCLLRCQQSVGEDVDEKAWEVHPTSGCNCVLLISDRVYAFGGFPYAIVEIEFRCKGIAAAQEPFRKCIREISRLCSNIGNSVRFTTDA